MHAALWLLSGLFLAQPPAASSRPVSLLTPVAVDDAVAAVSESSDNDSAAAPAQTSPEPETAFSIFSRPVFADRNSLSFVRGSGPGRFDLIDWESRPNRDRYWWLGRWPAPEEVQLNWGIGFNFHWWAGPVHNGADAPPSLPAHVFDLYLDWSWSQRWSDRLSTEVRFRPGLYTDFRTTPPDAFRIPGEAVGVWQAGPDLYLVGGAEYQQRNDIHLLPIGGVLWQPTPSWELSLIFPEPKIAVELSSKQHLWGYVAAEYGGGRWTYKNDEGHSERVESSDYRVVWGVEWRDDYLGKMPSLPQTSAAFIEVGYVFERHVRLAVANSDFQPRPAWMIRFGYVW